MLSRLQLKFTEATATIMTDGKLKMIKLRLRLTTRDVEDADKSPK